MRALQVPEVAPESAPAVLGMLRRNLHHHPAPGVRVQRRHERIDVDHVVEDVVAHDHVRHGHFGGDVGPRPLADLRGDPAPLGCGREQLQHVRLAVGADQPGGGRCQGEARGPAATAHVQNRARPFQHLRRPTVRQRRLECSGLEGGEHLRDEHEGPPRRGVEDLGRDGPLGHRPGPTLRCLVVQLYGRRTLLAVAGRNRFRSASSEATVIPPADCCLGVFEGSPQQLLRLGRLLPVAGG